MTSPRVGSVERAGLRYAGPEDLTIQRRRHGKGFRYVSPASVSKCARERIRQLAIPPAWTDVRICPDETGHLQATGRDQRGRLQYLYHPAFRALQDEAKFDHLLVFGEALPAVRAAVETHLSVRGHGRNKVLAAIVHLLDTALIRVGNAAYARSNGSFGLTTLRSRQVQTQGDDLRFQFRGKSGRLWRLRVRDRRVAKVVRACQELPGQELFQYLDDDQTLQSVTSSDVNAYLRTISGAEITSKDFRTWAATTLAVDQLAGEDAEAGKSLQVAMIRDIAARLGNTPSVCRKAYIHPLVLEGALDQRFIVRLQARRRRMRPTRAASLSPSERLLLELLVGAGTSAR